MRRSRRRLPLSVGEIFSDAGHDKELKQSSEVEWKAFVGRCNGLFRSFGCKPSPRLVDAFAARLSDIVNNSYRAGLRQAAILQSGMARVGKKRKTDERGRIIRRAILSVCHRQRVKLVASEKFAVSIRSDVIKAAMEVGLTNASAGTSPRSIQRHIAALLKDHCMQ